MIFGKERNKGIRFNNNKLEVVTIGENGITEEDIMVHDATNPDDSIHYNLVRMGLPEFPVAMGVIRSAESTVFESMMHDQVQHAMKTTKIKTMDDLLNSGNTFRIDE